ncbi:pentatricopeptide repeat-containing protein At3g13150-like [Lycium ferocissimum]|uniref:pentatricopeptide repeat-containing protein At3g13150-like n=1 Tax=Lycium ferocissimum TaxID=112874 RepID=UPI0028152522|nr:pentatricopeptide repeat-containing protein At3g13150-like [Lycium ferocissimum]
MKHVAEMASSSPSLYRRLHDVFTKTPKPHFQTAKDINLKEIQSLVHKFKQSSNNPKFRQHFTNYESFIRQLIRTHQFSAIENVIQHQKIYPDIKNERFVVRFIWLYGKAGMFDHAQKLFDEMPHLKCERTVMSFNALLAAAVNSNKYDNITEIFKELPGKLAIEPDIFSYNTMIKAFCNMGSLDSLVPIMDKMKKSGVDPCVITFNTLLDGFYKNNRFSEAENIWTWMENTEVIPNVRSYNSRLRGLVENNHVLEAEKLFEEMKKKGVKPDTHSHNAMITAYAKDGNLELAKSWYAKLGESGCLPDHVTFSLLIPLARDKDDPDFAYELCKKCIDLRRNVYTFTMQRVIDMLVTKSMIKEAKELVELGRNCSFRYRLEIPNDLSFSLNCNL